MKRNIRKIIMLICLFAMVLPQTSAFAANDVTQTTRQFADLYTILRGVGLAGAFISLSITGILMVMGNDQSAEKAKKAAILICVAVAAMYLIPTFVKMGVTWGKAHKWNPPRAN